MPTVNDVTKWAVVLLAVIGLFFLCDRDQELDP